MSFLSCWSKRVLAAGLLSLVSHSPASSCFLIPRSGETVRIANETAVILWDAEQQVEHFIRQGTFATSSRDFGFLVPTPTVPELSEVNGRLFDELGRITAPRIEVITRKKPRAGRSGGCGCDPSHMFTSIDSNFDGTAATPDAKMVTVHSQQTIAGQDVAVLSADDAETLATWLREHEYSVHDQLSAWLAPYIARGWKITAFKFAQTEEGDTQVQSQAVCLSFSTTKPFYPYREPAPLPAAETDAASGTPAPGREAPSRLLRVFFLGSERVDGVLGDSDHQEVPGDSQSKQWPGHSVWSRRLFGGEAQQVLTNLALPGEVRSGPWWLTEFEDHASPRPGWADLFFQTSVNKTNQERPPIIQYRYVQHADTQTRWLLVALAAGCVLWLRPRSRCA